MNWYKIIKISNIENILKNINMKQEYINDITSFLNNISDTRVKGKYIAAIKEGIKSNPNFNINDLKNINIKQNYIPSQEAQELLNRYKNEKIYNWLRKELSKNNEANLKVIEDNINHIIDWIKDENLDINNYKLEDAIKLSNEWTSRTFKNASDKYSSNIIDMQFKDGFTMKKVTPEDAKVEGKKMNHCVGSYEENIKNDKVEVYSLRDKNNEPHVTIAIIYGETVTELKGNSNSNPNEKYGKYIEEWLNKHKEIEFYQNEENAEGYGLKDVNRFFDRLPKGTKSNEKNYILKGIRYNIDLLYDISEELANNINFWEKVVVEKGSALYYVPNKFKTYEMCLKAVKNEGMALSYVSEEMRMRYPDICMESIKQDGYSLIYVPDEIKIQHPEICEKAVEENGNALRYISPILRTPEICLKAVENFGLSIEFVPIDIQYRYPELHLKAIENNPNSILNIHYDILNARPELCLKAVEKDGESLYYVPEGIKLKYPEICMKAIENKGFALRHVPPQLKTEELCLKAIKNNKLSLKFVTQRLKNDKDFIEKANKIIEGKK